MPLNNTKSMSPIGEKSSHLRPGEVGKRLRDWKIPTAFAAGALVQFAGGGWIAWNEFHAVEPIDFRPTAAAILLLTGAIQTWLAWTICRRTVASTSRRAMAASRDYETRSSTSIYLFARWLTCGAVLAYAACVMMQSPTSAGYFFIALLAAWNTLLSAASVLSCDGMLKWIAFMKRRPIRIAGWAFYSLLVAPIAIEAGVAVHDLWSDASIAEIYRAERMKLMPGVVLAGRTVNSDGYWDKPFEAESHPGVVRIAVLGGQAAISECDGGDLVTRIEERLPGVEIYNFSLPNAGLRDYAVLAARDVFSYQPDMLIVVLSAASDIVEPPEQSCWFDPRGLGTYQLAALSFGGPGQNRSIGVSATPQISSPVAAHDEAVVSENCRKISYDSLRCGSIDASDQQLEMETRRLRVCRTPIDVAIHERWRESFANLDRIDRICRDRGVPWALVVVPAPFQLNSGLCDVLRRRAGYQSTDLDLELPQRRLRAYAKERKLVMLDLLPYLRTSRDPAYSPQAHRLTAAGSVAAADILGQWIPSHFGGLIAARR